MFLFKYLAFSVYIIYNNIILFKREGFSLVCKIADFIIDFKTPSLYLKKFLDEYQYDGIPQFTITVTEEEIKAAQSIGAITANALQGEINAIQQKLITLIPLYNAFFFHASLIEVDGLGIAFTALSGTGKTTHTLLWQKLLDNKMQIINGDKPIIRFIDGIPYGYGTPWCGKEHFGINKKVPIKHLCFIERSEKNSCEKITSKDTLKNIFSQIFIPKEPAAALKTLELLDKLLNSVEIWVIKCNTDISAAKTAYNSIFKEN